MEFKPKDVRVKFAKFFFQLHPIYCCAVCAVVCLLMVKPQRDLYTAPSKPGDLT